MNPYTLRGMIRNPAEFFGRNRELREIFTLLGRPASCSIVGPRRIGKSSLLYQISNPTVYTRDLAQPERYVFIFLDLLELAKLEVDGFFQTVLERVCSNARSHQGRNVLGWRLYWLQQVPYNAIPLKAGNSSFASMSSKRMSSNASFGDDFFGYLRSLAYNYNLAYVISSQRSLFSSAETKTSRLLSSGTSSRREN